MKKKIGKLTVGFMMGILILYIAYGFASWLGFILLAGIFIFGEFIAWCFSEQGMLGRIGDMWRS